MIMPLHTEQMPLHFSIITIMPLIYSAFIALQHTITTDTKYSMWPLYSPSTRAHTWLIHMVVAYLDANECIYQLTCIWEMPLWGIFILSVKHMKRKQTMNWLWPIFCLFNISILPTYFVFFWMHFLNRYAVLIFSLHTKQGKHLICMNKV